MNPAASAIISTVAACTPCSAKTSKAASSRRARVLLASRRLGGRFLTESHAFQAETFLNPPSIQQCIRYGSVSDTSMYRTTSFTFGTHPLENACPRCCTRSAGGPSAPAGSSSSSGSPLLVALGGGAAPASTRAPTTASASRAPSRRRRSTRSSRTFPQVSGTSAQLVVVAPDGGTRRRRRHHSSRRGRRRRAHGHRRRLRRHLARTRDSVKGTISDDGSAAIITVQLKGSATTVTADDRRRRSRAGATTSRRRCPPGSKSPSAAQLFSQNLPGAVGHRAARRRRRARRADPDLRLVPRGRDAAAHRAARRRALDVRSSSSRPASRSISSTTPLLALMLGPRGRHRLRAVHHLAAPGAS